MPNLDPVANDNGTVTKRDKTLDIILIVLGVVLGLLLLLGLGLFIWGKWGSKPTYGKAKGTYKPSYGSNSFRYY